MDLYSNSELVPTRNNTETKEYLLNHKLSPQEMPVRCSHCNELSGNESQHDIFVVHLANEHGIDYDLDERKFYDEDLPVECRHCNKLSELETGYDILVAHLENEHGIEHPNIKTFYDKILLAIPIFNEMPNSNEKVELQNLLIRKIQIDLLYYAVMMNFRRGLVVATEKWAKADEKLKKSERNRVFEDAEELDLAAKDLRDTVTELIGKLDEEFSIKNYDLDRVRSITKVELKNEIGELIPFLKGVNDDVDWWSKERGIELRSEMDSLVRNLIDREGGMVDDENYDQNMQSEITKDELKDKLEKLILFLKDVRDEDYTHQSVDNEFKVKIGKFIPIIKDLKEGLSDDNVSEEVKNKIERIKDKMANRNKWNSDEWRAMGSIYYKWKEAGKDRTNANPEDPQEPTRVEKFWNWWNFGRKHIDLKEMPLDPTEKLWNKNRTIRAVNSLQKSFGYEVKEDYGNAILFFGVVFGLIIAVALTNSLDILIGALQTSLDCDVLNLDVEFDCFHPDFYFVWENIEEYQSLLILFFCFFPLGILFYHQGTILLSDKAAEQMTLGSNVLVFVNFLFILVQAIIVYFLAASIGDVDSFLSFLILLVTVDAIWVLLFTFNDMRDDVHDAPVFIEWVIFDIVIGLFAAIFLIHYASVPPILEGGWEQNLIIFVMLLVVLTTRAVVDYSYGWKNFWSKFAGAE